MAHKDSRVRGGDSGERGGSSSESESGSGEGSKGGSPGKARKQEKLIRRWILFFIVALVFSGLTAFALESELYFLLVSWPGHQTGQPGGNLYRWVREVYGALWETNDHYPFLAYGYDLLAFEHLVIAIAFICPLRDPVRNKWIIEFGMIACIFVEPR